MPCYTSCHYLVARGDGGDLRKSEKKKSPKAKTRQLGKEDEHTACSPSLRTHNIRTALSGKQGALLHGCLGDPHLYCLSECISQHYCLFTLCNVQSNWPHALTPTHYVHQGEGGQCEKGLRCPQHPRHELINTIYVLKDTPTYRQTMSWKHVMDSNAAFLFLFAAHKLTFQVALHCVTVVHNLYTKTNQLPARPSSVPQVKRPVKPPV